MVLVDRVRHFSRTPNGRQLAFATAVGCLLRLAWGIWAARGTPDGWIINGDQYSYWFFGNEIARGHGYLSYITGKPTSYYPVGYPIVLAVVYWLGLHTPLPDNQAHLTAALHVLLSTASIVLVYFIGRKAFGHRVGLIAAWIVALFPSLIVGVATFSVETTFIFSALVCVAILVDHDWASGPMTRKRLLWFGVALGCSVLIRPFSSPMLIGLAVAVWCAGRGWRSVLRHVGWAALTFVLVLTPWTIRNEMRFDAFIPISTNLGDGCACRATPARTAASRGRTTRTAPTPTCPRRCAIRPTPRPRSASSSIIPREELRQIPKRFLLMMDHDHRTLAEALGNGSHLTVPF